MIRFSRSQPTSLARSILNPQHSALSIHIHIYVYVHIHTYRKDEHPLKQEDASKRLGHADHAAENKLRLWTQGSAVVRIDKIHHKVEMPGHASKTVGLWGLHSFRSEGKHWVSAEPPR